MCTYLGISSQLAKRALQLDQLGVAHAYGTAGADQPLALEWSSFWQR